MTILGSLLKSRGITLLTNVYIVKAMVFPVKSEVAQLCLPLSDPMDCSLQGSSVHWIFQARVLERVAIAFSEFTQSIMQMLNQRAGALDKGKQSLGCP